MSDLAFAPATEQAALARAGDVSPSELVALYLDRIEALNPVLNCYITVARERALDAAHESERRLRAGDARPYEGVPISVKDLADTAGIRTTMGSAGFADRVPDADDGVVAWLRDAGFVVIGKTNTPDHGIGSTDPVGYGACRNPWDTERTTGGSSGGAACAVSAGLCAIAHGTDGGGSIRIPAAFCGVYGLKPSRGRISHWPKAQHLLATDGPLTRTVADAAAFLDATAGYRTGDAWWLPSPQRPFADAARSDPGRLRVAFSTTAPSSPAHGPNDRAVTLAAKTLERLGHDVEEAAPAWPGPEADERLVRVFSGGLVAQERSLPPEDTLDPIIRGLLDAVRSITLAGYLEGVDALHALARDLVAFFDRYDVLVMPAVAYGPGLVSELRTEAAAKGNILATSLWNVTGQPAATLPLAHDDDGIPVGVQVVARPAAEDTLLSLSAQLEAELPWAGRRPPVTYEGAHR